MSSHVFGRAFTCVSILVFVVTGVGGRAEGVSSPTHRLAVPVTFEANRGQTDASVAFLSRRPGHVLFLTPTDAVLRLRDTAVRMRLVGARANVTPRGLQEQTARSHYFVGNHRERWHTNVPHFARVVYDEVYPGIDLMFHGDGALLEFDLVVAPGADADAIRIRYDGGDGIDLDASGDLRLRTPAGSLVLRRPIVYQERNGERVAVAGAYVLYGENDIGFALGEWDRTEALVIDPELGYGTYLGGTGFNDVTAVAVDVAGTAYVAGVTQSADFPTTSGAYAESKGAEGCPSPPCNTAFVAHLTADGSALLYATYLGGSSSDAASGVAIDAEGNAYVAGGTTSNDFPTTPGAAQTQPGGLSNTFITKLDPTGSTLVYSTYLGGSGNEDIAGIAVDGNGSAYVAGITIGSPNDQTANDFHTTPGAFRTTCNVGTYCWDAFVTKLTPDGSALAYSTFLGGTLVESVYGIAVDGDGNAYVAGDTPSTDFPTTLGAFQEVAPANVNLFVAKLDAAGSTLVYSTYLGGSNNDGIYGGGLALDAARHVYVTSWAESTDFPTTPGAFQEECATLALGVGVCDAGFVAKLTPDGAGLEYATYLGGALGGGNNQPRSIAVDVTGRAYVTGITNSTDFPTRQPLQPVLSGDGTAASPGSDAFVVRLDPGATKLEWSTYLGGRGLDEPREITVSEAGHAFIVGLTTSEELPVSAGALRTTLATPGTGDGYVVRIDPGPTETQLAAAVLPSGRSVRLGQTATAFATIINAGTETAFACSVVPIGSWLSTFGYQTTDPATNALTGTANTPVNIPPGGSQSYVFWATPEAQLVPLPRDINFSCHNGTAENYAGVNTFLYSASAAPVADLIALVATVPPAPGQPPDGIVRIPGPTGAAAFAVAAINVGAEASLTVSAESGLVPLPLTINICETVPLTGACMAPPSGSITRTFAAGATATFGVFLTAHAAIPFAPATNRVFVGFVESTGFEDVRGLTSVAVMTP